VGALLSVKPAVVLAPADGETSPKPLSTKPALSGLSFSTGNRTAAAHFPK